MVYYAPRHLEDAVDFLSNEPAIVLAGGTDVFPSLGERSLAGHVLDLSRLLELRAIDRADGMVRIGAAAPWSDIVATPLPAAFDALKCAARQIGGIQIQNAGTIGGNICNASPAADGVPPLLVLDARVELVSARGVRRVALSDFILGVRKTDRASDEIVSAIVIPEPPEDAKSAFLKLGSRSHLVISIVMVAAFLRRDSAGRIAEGRVAVGACAPTARRMRELERDLPGKDATCVEVTAAHLGALAPIDDVRASAEYRMKSAATLCQRAIAEAGCRNG
jgi:CO/xanthine dehydrogenase FAD-binding subunit